MKLLEPGAVLDGFVIEQCIHHGGMAHIYLVRYAAVRDAHESPAHDRRRRG
jgi:eukaryotic-like serine/threonine-protein kinase